MIYVYVLQSLIDKKYYIGISKNLEKRLERHNDGGVTSTIKRRPFRLVYTEEYEDYLQARKREQEIKSYKGGNKFKELIS